MQFLYYTYNRIEKQNVPWEVLILFREYILRDVKIRNEMIL